MTGDWNSLVSESQLDEILKSSYSAPVVIFKHSTRCSVSTVALNRLAGLKDHATLSPNFYFLDLIRYRSVSNAIAERLGVWHESPQVLVVRDGNCIYDASHLEVNPEELEAEFTSVI